MRVLFCFVLLLNILIAKSQNIDNNINIIDHTKTMTPVIFYDSMISDTLKGYITVAVRFNVVIGDTIVELTPIRIEVMTFRLKISENNIIDIRKYPEDLSGLSIKEIHFFNTYSEKIINLYWKQPYNSIRDILKLGNYNVSALSFGCPFDIIPCK